MLSVIILHLLGFRYPEDIFSICGVMTDDGIGAAIDRLAAVNDIMLEMNGIECLDHTYQTFLDDVQTTEWVGEGGDVSFVWRPWLWQTCTEFGWYQTTNQVASFV